MKYSLYNFKFYLNANHAIYLHGVLGQNHPHTWEISLDTIKVRNDFVQFDYIEKSVEEFFAEFQDSDINKIEPFTVTNPTLENLCEVFKKELGNLLNKNGWLLTKIKMSETPTRAYIIDRSDEIDKLIESEFNMEELTPDLNKEVEKKLNEILGKE